MKQTQQTHRLREQTDGGRVRGAGNTDRRSQNSRGCDVQLGARVSDTEMTVCGVEWALETPGGLCEVHDCLHRAVHRNRHNDVDREL